jgi:integrase/recombinase XerD
VSALRFLFIRTLHRHEFRQFLPYPKVRRKLPKILSKEEVARLIDASSGLFERTLLMVLYGTGMRRAEIAGLTPDPNPFSVGDSEDFTNVPTIVLNISSVPS